MNIINVSEDLPGFIARLTSFTSNLHHLMREFVQSLKNRIIFKIYGQFQSGLPIFRKKKINRDLWRDFLSFPYFTGFLAP